MGGRFSSGGYNRPGPFSCDTRQKLNNKLKLYMEDISRRIIAFNKDRLPDLVQLKYESMTDNPFRFFRGTNHIFYDDLQNAGPMPESPAAWICGDLHLENFGTYKSDNRLIYFDLNDFDEAILAPVSW